MFKRAALSTTLRRADNVADPTLSRIREASRIGRRASKDLAKRRSGDPSAPPLRDIQLRVAKAQRMRADARYDIEFPSDAAHAEAKDKRKKQQFKDWIKLRLQDAKEKAASVDHMYSSGDEIMSNIVEGAFLDEFQKIAMSQAAKSQLATRTRQAMLHGQKVRDTGKLIQKGKIEIPVTQRGVKWDDVKKSPKGGILKRLARFKDELKNGPKKKNHVGPPIHEGVSNRLRKRTVARHVFTGKLSNIPNVLRAARAKPSAVKEAL